jgi:hypothetical protein
MYTRLRRFGLPLLLLCGACVSSRANARHRVDMSVLTQNDLEDHQYENVLEAVQTLRSNWLNERGPDSFAAPSHIWVYIDNTKVGGVQSLAQISTRYVSSIRKVNGIDATARWGIGHSAGVIAVMTWPPQDASLPPTTPAPADSTASTAHHLN